MKRRLPLVLATVAAIASSGPTETPVLDSREAVGPIILVELGADETFVQPLVLRVSAAGPDPGSGTSSALELAFGLESVNIDSADTGELVLDFYVEIGQATPLVARSVGSWAAYDEDDTVILPGVLDSCTTLTSCEVEMLLVFTTRGTLQGATLELPVSTTLRLQWDSNTGDPGVRIMSVQAG